MVWPYRRSKCTRATRVAVTVLDPGSGNVAGENMKRVTLRFGRIDPWNQDGHHQHKDSDDGNLQGKGSFAIHHAEILTKSRNRVATPDHRCLQQQFSQR